MNNEYYVSGIILVGIISALILIPIFASDTIFLVNENGGTPTTCTGNSGFVLAQNMTDLCDVTIISPISSQIIRYNGTQWVNVNSTSFDESTDCTSAGGTTIIKTSSGGDCDFKGLTAGVGLTLTSNTNDNNYKTNFVNGTGISITGSTSQTFTNTGVISLTSADTDGLSLSASTGAITITPKWELLCQTTLGSSNSTISCSSISARNNIMIQIQTNPTGGTQLEAIRFNGDAANNYATRRSSNGGADSTATSVAQMSIIASTTSVQQWDTCFIKNTSSLEKLTTCSNVSQSTSGAGNAPARTEMVGKWANTSVQITAITIVNNGGTGSFNTGSQLTVWGYN